MGKKQVERRRARRQESKKQRRKSNRGGGGSGKAGGTMSGMRSLFKKSAGGKNRVLDVVMWVAVAATVAFFLYRQGYLG